MAKTLQLPKRDKRREPPKTFAMKVRRDDTKQFCCVDGHLNLGDAKRCAGMARANRKPSVLSEQVPWSVWEIEDGRKRPVGWYNRRN